MPWGSKPEERGGRMQNWEEGKAELWQPQPTLSRSSVAIMALQNYLRFAEKVRPVYLFNLIVHWKRATLERVWPWVGWCSTKAIPLKGLITFAASWESKHILKGNLESTATHPLLCLPKPPQCSTSGPLVPLIMPEHWTLSLNKTSTVLYNIS